MPRAAIIGTITLLATLSLRTSSFAFEKACAVANDGCAYVVDLLQRRQGYGAQTKGGAGGEIVIVTSDADSGQDTLRAALSHKGGARWIRFAWDMTINLKSQLRVPSNVTIDGRGHNVRIRQFGLSIVNAEHVIVTNLSFDGQFAQFSQAINIANRSRHVWINHLDLSRFKDRLLNVKTGSTDVTISWVKFHNHDKVMLLNNITNRNLFAEFDRDSALRVTLHGNWFVDTIQRNPRAQFGTTHLYNNLLENWDFYGMSFSLEARALIEGNIFINNPKRACSEPDKFETTHGVDRNYCQGIGRAQSRAILPNGSSDKALYEATREQFGYSRDYRAFLRIRDNIGLEQSKIDDFRPEAVPQPAYCYLYVTPGPLLARIIRETAGNTVAPTALPGLQRCPSNP